MFSQFIRDDDPIEHCGLFIKADSVGRPLHTSAERPYLYVGIIVELPNRAIDPTDNFTVYQSDVDHALRWLSYTPSDVLGYWHTHPQGSPPEPSQADLDSIALGDKNWWHCVIQTATNSMVWFDYYENRHRIDLRELEASGGLRVPVRSVRLREGKRSKARSGVVTEAQHERQQIPRRSLPKRKSS